MGPDVLRLCPAGFALHTRDREDDYRWYCQDGEVDLLPALKEIYKGVIADQEASHPGGQPATFSKPATFALLDCGLKLGILVANLKTSRFDHSRTRILDAIFLE